ncbi:cysteine hydrolase family protein [Aliamphritea ceti]|uniref:cysteine hydrolase family protein n=1 Tax=Aliamphritea ceti TaxID=1524258 RepID=UPI0021C462BF|nr:cysteine hydrolase family protein [Aliamphritea ceti]
MAKTALLLIDFQNDYFQGGKWQLVGTEAAADQGARLLSAFREKSLPVVHVRHEFPTNEAPFFLPGSEGAQIHPSVAPLTGEPVVLKQQINSFRDTELKQLLDEQGIEHLIIVGAMSHMCIDAGARAAADFGYQVAVAHDACATLDLTFEDRTVPAADVHNAYMSALSFGYGRVASTDELLADL